MGIDGVYKNFEHAERKDFYKKCADLCGPELKKELAESVTWYKKKHVNIKSEGHGNYEDINDVKEKFKDKLIERKL